MWAHTWAYAHCVCVRAHACIKVGSLGAGVAGSCEPHYMGAGTWLQCWAGASVARNCWATAPGPHTSVLKCLLTSCAQWLWNLIRQDFPTAGNSLPPHVSLSHMYRSSPVFFFHETFREFWIVSFYETELGALSTGRWWVLTIRARKFWNEEVCHRREKPLEAAGKITESSAGHRLLVNYEWVHKPLKLRLLQMLLKFIGRHWHEFIFLPTIAFLAPSAHTLSTKRSRVYLWQSKMLFWNTRIRVERGA